MSVISSFSVVYRIGWRNAENLSYTDIGRHINKLINVS